MNTPCTPGRYFILLLSAGLTFSGVAAQTRGADPLDLVPADVCGVIVFRHIESTLKKFDAISRTIHPDSDGISLEDFETVLNLEPDTLDPSQPVVLIILRPEFRLSNMVVSFVPKNPSDFREQAGGERGFTRKYEGPEADAFVAMRQGVGFLGPTRRCLRLARLSQTAPLLHRTFDASQQQLLNEADVYVHLPLLRWREEKITPMFSLATNLIKLATASRQAPSHMADAMAMLDYMFAGARVVLDEMESAAFSLMLDDRTIRLSHYHTFQKGGRTHEFLAQAGLSEVDLLNDIPDVPFMFLMVSNWTNTTLPSLSSRFCDHVCNSQAVVDTVSAAKRAEIARTSRACYDQTTGYYSLIGISEGADARMRLLGGFAMKDAEEGLRQMRFIQENASEALASILPGPGTRGAFTPRRLEGYNFLEMPAVNSRLSEDVREQTVQLFGAKALMQQAAADRTHLVYSLSEPPFGVSTALKLRSAGKTLRNNPAMRDLVDRLPSHRHGLVVLDLDRVVQGILRISSMPPPGLPCPEDEKPPTSRNIAGAGPLVGWALKVENATMTGQMAINVEDVPRLMKSLHALPRTLGTTSRVVKVRQSPAPAPPAPLPPPVRKLPRQ